MNVSLQQLKVFVAVARQRSFTRAAREFDLTQSAVSRCVRELEESIALRLFDRTTRQVELTTAGSRLERRIGRLIEEIELTLREERAAHEEHTGLVVVACDPVTSSGWLPERLARSAAHFPDLIVTAKEQPQHAVLAAIEQGEVDFGVLCDANVAGADAFHMQPLVSTPLCAVLPHAHPLASGAAVHWEALRNSRSVTQLVTLNAEAGTRNVTERALNTHRIDAARANECGHLAAALRMIELGLGIGVLPVDPHGAALPASLVARPLVPEVSVTTMLVRRRNRSLRPNAEAVWSLFSGKDLPAHAGASSTTGTTTAHSIIKGATHEPMPCVPDDEALMRAS
ncbi:LysR family transcriptional regulator [Paraburkholderia sabiae]|jgi:DNA-binding transcriptional LysR family regulator|uniref:LysR family transcriptional regulator n=1 Tax=Paraburkholderia sabiae TaxID=273251 RepID=A0ABU9QAM6_9BURK|nr:LysR family transcriptional regulator [Paraburkholderia sabiae]WJZ72519.1 LysR family transcriptional regulator [Paraburkholderia sabiae]CAD6536057.1 HTH-type transcriptional regulator HdfR [Paraburkholderia sabiae]CAG9200823.1 Transcriptional regulator, LysR family [Paraburkholderia sabiae]